MASDVFVEAYVARGNEPTGDDEVLWVRPCDSEFGGTPCLGQDPFNPANTCWEWYVQGPADAQPAIVITPEQVRDLFGPCAEAWISPPEVQSWPSIDTPAIVTIPTFVTVENWPPVANTGDGPVCDSLSMDNFTMNLDTGEFSVDPCLADVCISISGEPRLTFDPGDGTGPIRCQPPPMRYDPNGAEPNEQAADPHACAHIYAQRTTDGLYEAAVEVDWVIRWSTPTTSGTFDPQPDDITTFTFTRQVDEVQSVITDADLD